MVSCPFSLKIASVLAKEKVCLAIGFEVRPVAADDAIFGDDGLEDAPPMTSPSTTMKRTFTSANLLAIQNVHRLV